MTDDSKHVPPISKLEVASGLSALPSGPKLQHVKQPEPDQLARSEQSNAPVVRPKRNQPKGGREGTTALRRDEMMARLVIRNGNARMRKSTASSLRR
jgi:hypothetical protein